MESNLLSLNSFQVYILSCPFPVLTFDSNKMPFSNLLNMPHVMQVFDEQLLRILTILLTHKD